MSFPEIWVCFSVASTLLCRDLHSASFPTSSASCLCIWAILLLTCLFPLPAYSLCTWIILCPTCLPLSAPDQVPFSPAPFPLQWSHGICLLGSAFSSHHYPFVCTTLFPGNALFTFSILLLLSLRFTFYRKSFLLVDIPPLCLHHGFDTMLCLFFRFVLFCVFSKPISSWKQWASWSRDYLFIPLVLGQCLKILGIKRRTIEWPLFQELSSS